MGRFGVRVWALVATAATALGVTAAVSASPAVAFGPGGPTVTTVSGLNATMACDQTISASVAGTPTPAAPAPTGTVQFLDGATVVQTANLHPAGAAATATTAVTPSVSLATLTPGVHTITATYVPAVGETYTGSSSAPTASTFSPYKSTVAVAPIPSTARRGTPITFSATVTVDPHCVRKPSASMRPTGSVTFKEGATVLGSASLVNGAANFTTAALAQGGHTVVGSYAGDANFGPASAPTAATVLAASGAAWRAQTIRNWSQGTASLIVGGLPHVWYYDTSARTLVHTWWTGKAWVAQSLDGAISGINGRSPDDVGRDPSAILVNGLPHVFYYDATVGDLRHASYDGHAWHFEALDGFTGPRGRTNGDVGLDSTATIYNGVVHVFYRKATGPTTNQLRHAWLTGSGWSFQQLDVGINTGRDNTALVYANQLHVFSYTGSNLRHSWYTAGAWHFGTLDGTQLGPNGQVNNNVGAFAKALLWNGRPNVWYQQVGAIGRLRHAWWTGTAWNFETLDGAGNNAATGAVSADVGADITVLFYANAPHVWYRDATNHTLRHAWWAGSSWHMDVDDGFAGIFGQRVNLGVGATDTASAVIYNNAPHVFYTDAVTGQLRHAWYG